MIFEFVVLVTQYFLVSSILIQNPDYEHDNKKLLCPSVCNIMACRMGILTCSESGLTELPKSLPPNTKKILMINQDFSKSQLLSRSNFTEYSPPEHNITKITIQNCSLIEIKSATFVRLSYLETLDLSFNKLKEIKQHTFAGLNLKFLRLDGNRNVKLSSLSFQDLQVTSLSLIDCKLDDIAYSVFEPIAFSLTRLMLSKNRLKTLETKFDFFFQQLELIGLEENRFDCGQCTLFWLIGSMKSKILKNPDVQKMLFPRCYEPFRFKDRYIHDLSVSDIECPKPSVHRISILILPNNSATLTCTASDRQSQVVWTHIITANQTMPSTITNRRLSEGVHTNNLLIDQHQPVDVFSCTVTSPLGNRSSTKLQISWPKISDNRKNNNDNSGVLLKGSVTLVPKETMGSNSYFFQPQFSLIEMIAGVVGTFIGTLIVFIAMLRCIFYRMKIFSKSSQLREHTLSRTSSKKDNRKPYMTYETPIYSDSQTYATPTLSPTVNQSTLGHFIDFKTQQTIYDRNNK